MALVVGTDSYISQADATAYVTANYASSTPQKIAWTALSSDDKDAWLRRARQAIDQMILVGIKAYQTQTLAFPRAILATSYNYPPTGYVWRGADYIVQTAVPTEVTQAQVEEALALAVGVPKRLQLRRQGVRSYRLGNLSESYSGGAGLTGLVSDAAYQLLRPFLAGGVPIC
jgi:hypothetical protein